ELGGGRVEREHDLRLHALHARHFRDRADRRGREDPAGGEAGPHAHAPAGHGDLAEHEAVATFDEAHDALAHGAERDEPGHADGDAEHREEIPSKDPQPPHDGGPTGFTTRVRLDGSASSRSRAHSRSCEQNQRTRGDTKSGIRRGANACSTSSPSSTGATAVAGAATSARRGRGSRRQRATRLMTCWIAELPTDIAQSGGEPAYWAACSSVA